MKYKTLIPIIFSSLLGMFLGKTFFSSYETSSTVFYEGEKTYFIELGVYETKEEIKDYENYLILLEEDGYHLYSAITIENKDKALNLGKRENKNALVKEKYLTDKEFLSFLKEYDKILSIVEDDNDIKTILEIIIKNYKEMVV